MHWAQEVQYGPREGRQLQVGWEDLGHGVGVLHAGHLHGALLVPSADTIIRPTDEETETQQASASVQGPVASHGAGPCHPQHSRPRWEPGGWVESVMPVDLGSLGAKPLFLLWEWGVGQRGP